MTQQFSFEELKLKEAYRIKPFVAEDRRGKFIKDYSSDVFARHGIVYRLEEVFYTYSRKGVIRALHFQQVKEQPKLVRCVKGRIYDVIVDLRRGSPTYKVWLGFLLSEENAEELLVPSGFAHGYLVMEDAVVAYKCAERFYGEYDSGIRWDDPDIGIEWPLDAICGRDHIILSDKDMSLQTFAEWEKLDDAFRAGKGKMEA